MLSLVAAQITCGNRISQRYRLAEAQAESLTRDCIHASGGVANEGGVAATHALEDVHGRKGAALSARKLCGTYS